MAAIAAALCMAALPATAQQTPEEVVARYFETFRTGDYAANAAMMDPAALEELKSSMTQLVDLAGAEPAGELEATFGVSTAEELRALPAATLYERMLRSTLGRAEVAEVMASAEMDVIGHVAEGEDLAHVVYRMRMRVGETEVDQVQLAPLRRTADGWRVMLTGSLAGMMQGMGGR